MTDGSVDLVIPARRADLGGFQVGRVLPYARRRMVGPFIFLDHMGPLTVAAGAPRSMDVRPHPHIGLATVTYLFEGAITHRDSLGVEQEIRPAEVNWMTAGRGISHSERFEALRATGGTMHGIQAWVALPDAEEETAPAFEHYGMADMPVVDEGGMRARIIAGAAFGAASRVTTRSPLFYAHLELAQGGRVAVPDGHGERAAYVVRGSVLLDGVRYGEGQMLVFRQGAAVALAAEAAATVMLLGGEPVGPRHIWWNFVSSRKERIEQAKADWKAGRIPLPPADAMEHIPLPEEPDRAPPQPMS
ncbi:MAG: pirin family protein [Alphaproteobacteria bacterium]|nr:pirin family protein [Alphaproteobacteria bacterium]